MVSCCDMQIWIDKSSTGGVFSNLDELKGDLLLEVHTATSFSSIQVKLMGISKTVLEVPVKMKVDRGRKGASEHEVIKRRTEKHKLLQETVSILPSEKLKKPKLSKSVPIEPGSYRFPFSFRIPMCNKCTGTSSMSAGKSGSSDNQKSHLGMIHTEGKLPPSFSELGEKAFIRYFVKATAVRSTFMKNVEMTAYEPIVFLPLDDYRILMANDREAFTRRTFQLKHKYPEVIAAYQHRSPSRRPRVSDDSRSESPKSPGALSGFLKTFFTTPADGKLLKTRRQSPPQTDEKPALTESYWIPSSAALKPCTLNLILELRLRHPAFLVPSRFPNYQLYLMTKSPPETFQLFNGLTSGLGSVYLRYLKVKLVSATTCFASGYETHVSKDRTLLEAKSLCECLDLACAKLSQPYRAVGKRLYELEIPQRLYEGAVVPDSVPPSFKTCNVERKYNLVVTVGISGDRDATVGPSMTLETKVVMMSGLEPVMRDPEVGAYASRTELDRAMREAEFSRRSEQRGTTTTNNGTVPFAGAAHLPTYEEVVNNAATRRRQFTQGDFYYVGLDD